MVFVRDNILSYEEGTNGRRHRTLVPGNRKAQPVKSERSIQHGKENKERVLEAIQGKQVEREDARRCGDVSGCQLGQRNRNKLGDNAD